MDFSTVPEIFFQIIFFIFGLLFGSFSNVIIIRNPKGLSVVHPRSRCFSCDQQLKWYHNIPLFSWLLLRGKCAFCGSKVSMRYPIVELINGLLFFGLYTHLGFCWTLVELILFSWVIVIASFIDLDHMILPDWATLSGIVFGLVGALLNPERTFLSSVFGFLLGGGFLWAIAYGYYLLRKEEGMGGGDIKLLAWIGAVLGWTSIPFVILVSSIIGSVVGVLFMFKGKEGLKTMIPFGPYLSGAALLYIFWGEELSQWYFNLFIPGLSQGF